MWLREHSVFKVMCVLANLAVSVVALASQPAPFSFAGVTLDSDLDQIAIRYPHSTRAGQYIRVAPEDSHDHISAIEISGAGPSRRVRISFEIRREGQRPDYPTCAQVQRKLEQQFGPPGRIRRFAEEASQRADRHWTHRAEALMLICFAGAGGRLFAEAVQINRLDPGKQ